MLYVFIGLILVLSVLLILVVLAQNPKGGGLSSQFGGSGASQLMGVKKTGDFLEKATWFSAIMILVLSLGTNFFLDGNVSSGPSSPNLENTQQAPAPTLPALDDQTLPLDELSGEDSTGGN